jgi:hypothetical protein
VIDHKSRPWHGMDSAPRAGIVTASIFDHPMAATAQALAAPFIEAEDEDGEIWLVRWSPLCEHFGALRKLSGEAGNGKIDTLVRWRSAHPDELKAPEVKPITLPDGSILHPATGALILVPGASHDG